MYVNVVNWYEKYLNAIIMQKKITTTITNLTNSHLSREEKKKLFVKLLKC
jgi:hypothetical protein